METSTQDYNAQVQISELLNQNGSYKGIQDIAIAKFNIAIDSDSDFWHELEEMIVNKIKEQKEL